MTIEITSFPERGFLNSLRGLPKQIRFHLQTRHNQNHIFLRSLLGLMLILAVAAGDVLLKSYKYYSRIIDARLASGYLNSRPGIYAAPRVIRTGQKLSRRDLINALQRAGYVEQKGSQVWNGTFRQTESSIEVRPRPNSDVNPSVIKIEVNAQGIAAIIQDETPQTAFTLEPEVLSNDPSSKNAKRESLSYSQLPPVLVDAIIATEDQRFFKHSGIDPLGITRAVWNNLDNSQVRQGGSTITQQLVKNTYLSPEKTIQRKYAEAMLAFALERRLSKTDIFALYCSEVYLGQRGAVAVRGVKEAARIYFGKELSDLTLNEAATIAGMIQRPARYSPQHQDAAQSRRDIVLDAMVRESFITPEQAEATKRLPVKLVPQQPGDSLAPYFVDYVNRVAETEFATSAANDRLFTTIDLELQQVAESALDRQLKKLEAKFKTSTRKPQAAMVALDPKTGDVLAMVGGRNYAESQLNRATDARRQPGSTFKPFVYAAAIEDGMSPVRTFQDAPREFTYDRNKIYRPANFGDGYSMREVTMRSGLVNSLNVVTVDIAMQTGLARIANLAKEFGLPRPERYPALALGTEEVTPLELAAAYAVFANGGRKVYPRVIADVGLPPAAHGTVRDDDDQVVRPTTAYMITNMLAGVVTQGTARSARTAVKGTAIAGKTGTSRDGWFVGFTPNLVCVVWIGFDDNHQLGLTGSEAALPAWIDFINEAVSTRPELGGRNFECPEEIKFVEIDSDTGAISTLSCPHRELIAVTENLSPHVECSSHGNLPAAHEPEIIQGGFSEAVVTHHPQTAPARPAFQSAGRTTRVDVDYRGKRTLRNDLR